MKLESKDSSVVRSRRKREIEQNILADSIFITWTRALIWVMFLSLKFLWKLKLVPLKTLVQFSSPTLEMREFSSFNQIC